METRQWIADEATDIGILFSMALWPYRHN